MGERSPFEMPDLPRACSRCGTPYGLTRQPVKARAHRVDLFFCQACWMRAETARRLRAVAGAFAGVVLAGGVALWVSGGASGPFLVAAVLASAAAAGAFAYSRSAAPRYARVDRENLVLEVPGVGRVVAVGQDPEEGVRPTNAAAGRKR